VNLHEIPGGGGELEVDGPPVRPEAPVQGGGGLGGQPAPVEDGDGPGGVLTPPPVEVPDAQAP
jgi:hypothetical protein